MKYLFLLAAIGSLAMAAATLAHPIIFPEPQVEVPQSNVYGFAALFALIAVGNYGWYRREVTRGSA